MGRKRGITVHWGILLVVYLAILFATSMVALTSESGDAYFLPLLAAGIPIYVLASRAIMRESEYSAEATVTGPAHDSEAKVIVFPEPGAATCPADVARAAAEACTPQLRKLG